MKTIEIYTLRAYRSVHDFIAAPESYHAASYHENIEDVPVGGWARQDGSFEVTLKVTVLADSNEAQSAEANEKAKEKGAE